MLRKIIVKTIPNRGYTFLQKALGTTAAAEVNRDGVKPFSEIPKLPTIPYFGSGWIYFPLVGKYNFKKLHHADMQKYQEYGPIYLETLSTNLQLVQLTDPEDISQVFRQEGKFPERFLVHCFKKYRDKKKHLYNNGGLLTTLGQEWWDVRRQSQHHLMKPKAILAYLTAMDDVAREFTDRMVHLRGKDGGEVPDYLNELYKWGLESVALVALDTRLGCIDKNPNEDAMKMIQCVSNIFTQMMVLEFGALQLWKKYTSFAYIKFEKSMDYVSKKAFGFICEAKERLEQASEDHEATLLELLLSTTKDPRDVNAMLTDMIFAGIDTTSNTLAFTLYNLARNPEVQEKVYQEIKQNVKGTPLTAEDLNNVPYLKACIKESMRINPTIIGNTRKLTENAVFQGYEVPAGTLMGLSMYAVGQLEKYFPEPKKFRPERFLREQVQHNPFAFLPFGFGTRSCIGKRIAQQEMWTLLIRLIQRFRVEYNYQDIDMNMRMVATPDQPLRYQFYDR